MTGRHPLQGIWICETAYHGADPQSGAAVRQLTSQTLMATSIYGEDPYCSAKCGRIVVLRSHYTDSRAPAELWVVDLAMERSLLVTTGVPTHGLAQRAYGDFFYYVRKQGGAAEIVRLCLSTLDIEPVRTLPADHPGYWSLGSISPGERYYVNQVRRGPGEHEVVVLDLDTGEERTIVKGQDLFNTHSRFDRMNGENILIQWNRGQRWTEQNTVEIYDPNATVTLFVIDRDGTNRRELPIAAPYIPGSVSGHEAWVTGKPEIVFSMSGASPCYDDGNRVGDMLLYRLGDERPRVLAHAPELHFCHVSTSLCGRYWVADAWDRGEEYPRRAMQIVVGSITSGKFARLCDTGGTWAKYEPAHPHPYLTADNRWAIFGSLRTGTAQVYGAEIPDGFLEALD